MRSESQVRCILIATMMFFVSIPRYGVAQVPPPAPQDV
jgi:hypothetical protein